MKIPKTIKNKYFLSIVGLIAAIFFLQDYDLPTFIRYKKKQYKLEDEKAYYEEKIETSKKALEEITTDPEALERYAREKYFMKKDNEDVFVVVKKEEE